MFDAIGYGFDVVGVAVGLFVGGMLIVQVSRHGRSRSTRQSATLSPSDIRLWRWRIAYGACTAAILVACGLGGLEAPSGISRGLFPVGILAELGWVIATFRINALAGRGQEVTLAPSEAPVRDAGRESSIRSGSRTGKRPAGNG
jgi:hypothetical protein